MGRMLDVSLPIAPNLLTWPGVILVEGLDPIGRRTGDHTLACLPLRITGGDGGPARALLIEP